ncbi:MAG: P1 family peptidase [Rhodospirillales bacterium]|nr:P1 family peptidase [Rhodospirillales bacterium]
MARPGPRNLITDVDGILIGNAEDLNARTGVTVILPDQPVVAAVDVRGGGPGTRETDALDPSCLVERIHAVCLSGGSVFGLEAPSGVASWMSARGRGLAIGPLALPVVPAAILFDLMNGGDKSWGDLPPYRSLGRDACNAAATEFQLGNAGAGLGATAGSLKGGLGSASIVTEDGVQVGAIAAANPMGSVVMPGSSVFWAWPYEQDRELGGQTPPIAAGNDLELDLPGGGFPGTNTTLAVVATNLAVDRAGARRIATMAHDGLARAVRPVHTPFDGDTVFVISTGAKQIAGGAEALPAALSRAGSLAADCVARAIARGVYAADTLGDHPGYRSKFGATP